MSLLIAWGTFLTATLTAYSHGEDKPGPHGGVIRMPGAFHTEIVPDGVKKVKVYLLDINWKNPSIEDSSLKLRHGANGELAKCEIGTGPFYTCEFSKEVDLSKIGKLFVHAKRKNQIGAKIEYELPLKPRRSSEEHPKKP